MDKNRQDFEGQVRLQQYQEAVTALMNDIFAEMKERAEDTSPDAPLKLVESTAKKLKDFYSKWGKEGVASFLIALAKDYFRPELAPYYVFYYVPISTLIESSSKLVEENKDDNRFWEALAMAVLQHGLVQMNIDNAIVFNLSETQQSVEDIEDIID